MFQRVGVILHSLVKKDEDGECSDVSVVLTPVLFLVFTLSFHCDLGNMLFKFYLKIQVN